MKKESIVKRGVLSVACALIVTAVLLSMMAFLIANERLPLQTVKIVPAAVVFVTVLAASVPIVKYAEKNKLLAAVCAAAVYTTVCLMVIGIVAPTEELKLGWQIAVPFAASLSAGIWNSAKKARRR